MRREEISAGVGNIKDIYIQEAADYSVSVCKKPANKMFLVFERVGCWFRNENKLWLKLATVTVCIVLIGGMVGFVARNSTAGELNETAYKPGIMFEDNLYLLSSQKPDSFTINESELECVGSIEEVISGRNLPTKNLQSSGNKDLLGCNVYVSDQYPERIFVFDNSGKLFVYDINY